MYSCRIQNTAQSYRLSEAPVAPSTFDREVVFIETPESDLSARRIRKHTLFFLATVVTTTLTGASSVVNPPINSILDLFIAPTVAVIRETLAGNFFPLTQGLIFTTTLLV